MAYKELMPKDLTAPGDACYAFSEFLVNELTRFGGYFESHPLDGATEDMLFNPMKTMADDLRDAAEQLIYLSDPTTTRKETAATSLRTLLSQAIEELGKLKKDEVRIEMCGHAVASLREPKFLKSALKQLLVWFCRRAIEVPGGWSPLVRVHTFQTKELAIVRIFDSSNRFPDELRAQLFDPFASHDPNDLIGLFLAKAFIEIGNDGELVDRTAETLGDIGHTFEISLPLVRGEAT